MVVYATAKKYIPVLSTPIIRAMIAKYTKDTIFCSTEATVKKDVFCATVYDIYIHFTLKYGKIQQ